ncbi:hypothetical protein LguiB_032092 [Lonicera macranthoides]
MNPTLSSPYKVLHLHALNFISKAIKDHSSNPHVTVNIVDFNGSFLARVQDMIGANPIILVVIKVDLCPKGTKFNYVGDWVMEATVKKQLKLQWSQILVTTS